MTNEERLALAREAAKKKREEGGIEYLNPREKFERKPTRQSAISAKCFDCIGEDSDAGWKWSIGNCVMTDCSLFPFRPFQNQFGKPMPKALAKAMGEG